MDVETGDRIIAWLRGIATLLLLLPIVCVMIEVKRGSDRKHVDAGDQKEVVTAQWRYKQLTMDKCAWCGRTQDMNRHHAIPQSANPSLRDVRDNLVVLCRDCHFVLGHRCNWKQYNPDVRYICAYFTNCVRSADTRKEIEDATEAPVQGFTDAVVTNGAPEL